MTETMIEYRDVTPGRSEVESCLIKYVAEKGAKWARLLDGENGALLLAWGIDDGKIALDRLIGSSDMQPWHKLTHIAHIDKLAISTVVIFSKEPPDEIALMLINSWKHVLVVDKDGSMKLAVKKEKVDEQEGDCKGGS